MGLNIKDPIAHSLARTLAAETGETMTQAVTQAIRERLEHIRRKRQPESKVSDLLAIGRRCARALEDEPVDHGDMLYEARGLPR